MNDYQKIHDKQKQHMNDDAFNTERKDIHESWFRNDTVDFWRHKRMYQTIEPIAAFYPEKKWLTIGDGRYGLDANRLNAMFGIDVFPTDISQNMLEEGKERGIIKEYGVENAENLSFPDHSFDFVFCKESFHHFPRPIMALYEMIRVSKDGVILIEPNEKLTLIPPINMLKQLIKVILKPIFPKRITSNKHFSITTNIHSAYEPSGNYIYSISRREFVKIAHGLNLRTVAWKGLNDHYIKGCEFERSDANNEVFTKLQQIINKRDRLCKSFPAFHDYDLITIVLFKQEIDPKLKASMEADGFTFAKPIRNPYLD